MVLGDHCERIIPTQKALQPKGWEPPIYCLLVSLLQVQKSISHKNIMFYTTALFWLKKNDRIIQGEKVPTLSADWWGRAESSHAAALTTIWQ